MIRYITRMVIFMVCLLSVGSSADAEELLKGLAFQENIIPVQETDRSDMYHPTASRLTSVAQGVQQVGGLAVAEDTILFNPHSTPPQKTQVAVVEKLVPADLLASEFLEPEGNVVGLKTVRPAPPPPVFWFDRSPLATIQTEGGRLHY